MKYSYKNSLSLTGIDLGRPKKSIHIRTNSNALRVGYLTMEPLLREKVPPPRHDQSWESNSPNAAKTFHFKANPPTIPSQVPGSLGPLNRLGVKGGLAQLQRPSPKKLPFPAGRKVSIWEQQAEDPHHHHHLEE